jgi:hypothetical protein
LALCSLATMLRILPGLGLAVAAAALVLFAIS